MKQQIKTSAKLAEVSNLIKRYKILLKKQKDNQLLPDTLGKLEISYRKNQ